MARGRTDEPRASAKGTADESTWSRLDHRNRRAEAGTAQAGPDRDGTGAGSGAEVHPRLRAAQGSDRRADHRESVRQHGRVRGVPRHQAELAALDQHDGVVRSDGRLGGGGGGQRRARRARARGGVLAGPEPWRRRRGRLRRATAVPGRPRPRPRRELRVRADRGALPVRVRPQRRGSRLDRRPAARQRSRQPGRGVPRHRDHDRGRDQLAHGRGPRCGCSSA